jgi:hypothetical protein
MSNMGMTPQAWDRLVDDELSASERRDLLTQMEARPELWRSCALAFLEAQTLRREFRGLLAEQVASAATPASLAPTATHHLAPAQEPRSSSGPRRAGLGAWATAASWLVALGVGYGWATWRGGDPSTRLARQEPSAVPGPQLAAEGLPLGGADEALDVQDALTLVVSGPSGQFERLRLPLVEENELTGELAAAVRRAAPRALPPRVRHGGVDVETRRRYAPLYVETDGGLAPLVMPVDDAVVTPVSRRIY